MRWFPSSKLLLHVSHAALPILNSSKLPPVVDAADLIVFLNYRLNNQKFKIPLSEATPYHHNVFTFTLFLPEGRAGVAWEPFNKIMIFLSLSLSLVFKGLSKKNGDSVHNLVLVSVPL
jgi:hypothetical protein